MRCLRCNYEWLPRVPIVKMCPKCKSRDYDKKKEDSTPAPIIEVVA